MAPEQVMSDRDSEDEVDDDVADLEDRRVCIMAASFKYRIVSCKYIIYYGHLEIFNFCNFAAC